MKLIKKKSPAEYIIYSAVILLGILADQVTKYLAVAFLRPIGTQPVIGDAVHLTYVENRGAAFGMLADKREIFIVISTVAIIAIALYLYLGHADSRLAAVSLSMIVSGGIGNMIDRLALGYVVDFINFKFIKYPTLAGSEWVWQSFQVFNGADSFVTVGAVLLVIAVLRDTGRELKKDKK